jgi:hypothetical protein
LSLLFWAAHQALGGSLKSSIRQHDTFQPTRIS